MIAHCGITTVFRRERHGGSAAAALMIGCSDCAETEAAGPGGSGKLNAVKASSEGSASLNAMTNGCSHFGHFARLPAFVRETLNEEPQLGQVTGAFMDLLTAKRHVHRITASEFYFGSNAASGSLRIVESTPERE